MADFSNIFDSLSKNSSQNTNIPKEILNQYPYGEFPIRYTRSGQEKIRIQSEHRYENTQQQQPPPNDNKNLDIDMLLPIVQMMTNKNKKSGDLLNTMSHILFKNNPNIEKILSLFSKNAKKQTIENTDTFPNTNKIEISKLKRVDK